MKKVIDGLRYDTQKSSQLAYHERGYRSNHNYVAEGLYRTNNGRYFLAGKGGPASAYAVSVDQNSWSGGQGVIEVGDDVWAVALLESWGDTSALETHFSHLISEA
jgi:hypothetical protein